MVNEVQTAGVSDNSLVVSGNVPMEVRIRHVQILGDLEMLPLQKYLNVYHPCPITILVVVAKTRKKVYTKNSEYTKNK